MKLRLCCLFITMVGLSGCLLRSIHPFTTDQYVIDPPEINGEWDLISECGEDRTEEVMTPWIIRADVIMAFDEEGNMSKLKTTYFELDDMMFADVTIDDVEGLSSYKTMYVLATHAVFRIEKNPDELRFVLLKTDWMKEAHAQKRIPEKLVQIHYDDSLYSTASSGDWIEFLKEHGNNQDVFDRECSIVLKKRQAPVADLQEKFDQLLKRIEKLEQAR